ncbi:MAG: hypothetical protein ACLU38_00575 [Dysosmobacter sp.]
MNSNTIAKFHLFGKVGKIVMTVLSVIAALITVSCCIATAFTATLPEDALTVRVVEHAEFRFNKASFDTLWSILGGSFTYSGKEFPEYMLEDSEKKASPPENQEFQAELKIFNQSYASAEIHSDESAKVMEADTSPEEYNIKDLVTVFIFLTLFSASATAALWMLRRLFAVLTRCGSPFCCEVVNRMRRLWLFSSSCCSVRFHRCNDAGKFLDRRKKRQCQYSMGRFDCFCCNYGLGGCFQVWCSAAERIG